MRELKIGDRVVDWKDRVGTTAAVVGDVFHLRYDGQDHTVKYHWEEFDGTDEPVGTFRFEDTEYPEWPR